MKHIDGYGTKYTITRDGRVINNKTSNEIGSSSNTRYKIVALTCDNGIIKRHRVHRLVASAFIDRIDGKNQVDHIDGNRHNNSVDNLRWCTDEENQCVRTEQKNDGREYSRKYNSNEPIRITYNGVTYRSKKHLAKTLSSERGATEDTLKKRIREVIARNGTLYGFPIKIEK